MEILSYSYLKEMIEARSIKCDEVLPDDVGQSDEVAGLELELSHYRAS